MFVLSYTILDIILLILLFVIIEMKIIKGVRGIDRGGMVLVVILGVIGLLCSILGLLGASNINQLITQIPIDKANNIVIIGIEKFIAKQEFINIIYLVIGYITLIFEYIIYKIMYKKYKQEQEQVQARAKFRWDLNKLN